jgi:hypothetical protein
VREGICDIEQAKIDLSQIIVDLIYRKRSADLIHRNLSGSASLSVLFGLICASADKREHAEKYRLGSRAGRANSWG